MNTTQVTTVLYQLQMVDLELDRVAADKQTISTSLQGSARLRKLRVEYDTARQQLLSGQQAQKEGEWSLDDVNQRLALNERRLYSGLIQNGKELQVLQHELQNLRAQVNRQEERLLEVMDATETLAETEKQKAAALQQAEEDWKQETSAFHARQEQAELRGLELQAKRQKLSATLNEPLLKRYETMRRTKQGRAISKVDQNSCQWCRVILTPSELQLVRISPELQTCTNCGRILYYER
jgi:predicted  nucleic acid-binding Zn-ribbon protein